MPLQTSGTISLNDIHVEAGGSSGSQASINDSDIRALINKSSGAQMAFSEWYGASSAWTATVTIGSATVLKTTVYGYNAGYYGSITDTTIDNFGNRTMQGVLWNGGAFVLNIINAPDSGWSRIKVHNTNFYRTQRTSYVPASSSTAVTQWQWSTTTNPFGATSGTRTVQFFN